MSYKIRVPDDMAAFIRNLHPVLKKIVRQALMEISEDPYRGKALKGELAEFRSYRVKKFRIIYKIMPKKQIGLVTIGPRKTIYQETFRIINREQRRSK